MRQDRQPAERATTQKMLDDVKTYRDHLDQTVARIGEPGQPPVERIQRVVQAYERDLDELLRRDNRESRSRLVDDLRSGVGSFDAQISETMQAEDPALRQAAMGLQASSSELMQLASDMEKRSWERMYRDHQETQQLVRRAEWVLIIVSSITLLLSILASILLLRQVVKPLVALKEAVDHAAAGNYEIEFDVEGDGEVVQLANAVRSLIAHVRDKRLRSTVGAPR